VTLAIFVVFVMMSLVLVGAMLYGAKLQRARSLERTSLRWLPWAVSSLAGAAAVTGALVGGASESVRGVVLTALIAAAAVWYLLWRTGARLPRRKQHSVDDDVGPR